MSDAESFVEDENKIKIEETCVILDCVKKEPKEEPVDLEDDRQYRIALKYKNIFGGSSSQRKFEEDYDNLIGFMDNDVIMENTMMKVEYIKEEGSFDNLHCSKCKGSYRGYCLKCSTLAHIINNSTSLVNSKSQWNTIPSDILEIRNTSAGKGVFLLRTLPIHIIFGPFEGILRIESTVGHCWKIKDNKLVNIKNGNWMKNIGSASSASFKNLDIFQVDGDLYFRTNREIAEGEELFIYYDNKELRPLYNTAECLYTPEMLKLPKIFACTLCCLGFSSNKCLMEHKKKCLQMDHSRSMKDFELIECHYCKMWMEKWEHEKYHVAYCLQKHHRRRRGYSEAIERSEPYGEEIEGVCGRKDDKTAYQRDMCSKPYDQRDHIQFEIKDYQSFSGANHGTSLNKYTFAKRTNTEHTQNTIEKKYKCSECSYQTNDKSNFQRHLNNHRGIKRFKCDICLMKFTEKGKLSIHIKIKHSKSGGAKDYKCSACSYESNYKGNLQQHLKTHRSIKPFFTCNICIRKFTEKSNLARHIKNSHAESGSAKDYKCTECSYRTNDKSDFRKHSSVHTGIKAFQCDICTKKFTRGSHLKKHISDKRCRG